MHSCKNSKSGCNKQKQPIPQIGIYKKHALVQIQNHSQEVSRLDIHVIATLERGESMLEMFL